MPIYTYTTIDDPLATQGPSQGTSAQDIDSTGQIIGWYRDVSGYHGFRLSGGKYTTFDDHRPLISPTHTASTIWGRSWALMRTASASATASS